MGVQRPVARLGQLVLDLLFPPRCASCGGYDQFICRSCADAMPKAQPPRCPVCWQRQPAADVCRRCQQQPPAFAAARSPFVYEGPVRSAVHSFKYGYVSALGGPMAALMAQGLRQHFPPTLVLVPVPLSPWRQRSRGYNQAALLARELATLCGLPLAEDALVRRRNTAPQARLTGESVADQRRRNVQGAFLARPEALPAGTTPLLVDDVMTSGATLDACALALKEAGASTVFALVFARED
ncbi:MAG: ComF family protein [Dehalococcoidia bacterium]